MRSERSIDIEAPAERVWSNYRAVTGWADWTKSVRSIQPLDGELPAVGGRFRIDQPRLPTLVWTVTDVQEGRSWRWEQRSPGGHTVVDHVVEPLDAGRTRVHLRLEQRGPIGALVGWLARGTTARYLTMEAEGLKAICESTRDDPATTDDAASG